MKKRMKLLAVCMCVAVSAELFVGCSNSRPVGEEKQDFAEGVILSENQKEMYYETKEGKKKLTISFTDAGYGNAWIKVVVSAISSKIIPSIGFILTVILI